MKLKKTWYGWLNFVIGTIFMSVFLFTLLVSLFEFNGFTTSLFGFYWLRSSFLVSGAVILLIVGLYLLIHFLKKNIHIKEGKFDKISLPIMWGLFFVLLSIGIYLRVNFLYNTSSLDLFNQSAYEKIVYVFEGNRLTGVDFLSNGYYMMEAFFLRVFGLKMIVPIVSNMVIQLIAATLLFVSVFISYGKSSAVLGFAYLMIFEAPVNYIFNISSDSFLLLITSFLILCISLSLRERRNGFMKNSSNLLLFFVFGVLLGILLYINPIFLILPVYYVICILLSVKEDLMGDSVSEHKLAPACLMFFVPLVTALILAFVYSVNSDTHFVDVLMNYVKKIGFSDYLRIYYPAAYIIECVVIIAFCLVAYISFIFKDTDNISAATILLSILYVAYSKNVTSVNVTLVLLEVFGILSGIGIKAYLFDDYTILPLDSEKFSEDVVLMTIPDLSDLDATEEIDITNAENSGSLEVKDAITSDDVVACEDITSGDVACEDITSGEVACEDITSGEVACEDIASGEVACEDITSDVVATEDIICDTTPENTLTNDSNIKITETDKPVVKTFEPIENVLPLPKKHVKKAFEYSFEPSPDEMKYDYEVSPDDDYDI